MDFPRLPGALWKLCAEPCPPRLPVQEKITRRLSGKRLEYLKKNGFCPGKLDMSEAKMRVIETIKTLGL
jgi:hypothetical protein